MTAEPPAGADQAGRMQRLRVQVQALRRRAGGRGPEGWLLLAGAVLVPLGVLLILLGWAGAAHTPFVFEQVPYLISGGLLGLALAGVGGFLYFAYWQTAAARETRSQQRLLLDALLRIETLLGGTATNVPGQRSAPAPVQGRAGAEAAASAGFVATSTGTMFHRPGCAVVTGRDNLVPVDPATTALRPCKICEPGAASSEESTAANGGSPETEAPAEAPAAGAQMSSEVAAKPAGTSRTSRSNGAPRAAPSRNAAGAKTGGGADDDDTVVLGRVTGGTDTP